MSPRQITEGQNMHESAGTRTLMCEIIGEIPLPHTAGGKKWKEMGMSVQTLSCKDQVFWVLTSINRRQRECTHLSGDLQKTKEKKKIRIVPMYETWRYQSWPFGSESAIQNDEIDFKIVILKTVVSWKKACAACECFSSSNWTSSLAAARLQPDKPSAAQETTYCKCLCLWLMVVLPIWYMSKGHLLLLVVLYTPWLLVHLSCFLPPATLLSLLATCLNLPKLNCSPSQGSLAVLSDPLIIMVPSLPAGLRYLMASWIPLLSLANGSCLHSWFRFCSKGYESFDNSLLCSHSKINKFLQFSFVETGSSVCPMVRKCCSMSSCYKDQGLYIEGRP